MSNAERRRLASVGAELPDPLFEALITCTSDAVFVLDRGAVLNLGDGYRIEPPINCLNFLTLS